MPRAPSGKKKVRKKKCKSGKSLVKVELQVRSASLFAKVLFLAEEIQFVKTYADGANKNGRPETKEELRGRDGIKRTIVEEQKERGEQSGRNGITEGGSQMFGRDSVNLHFRSSGKLAKNDLVPRRKSFRFFPLGK